MTRAVPFFLAVALLAPLPACAGNRTPDIVEDAAVYALSDRSRAVTLLEESIEDASARDRAAILLWAGEYRRLLGERDIARSWFERVIHEDHRHANLDAARAGIALIDAATSASPEVLHTLRRFPENALIDSQNADRFLVLAIVAAAEGDQRGYRQASEKAQSYSESTPGHSDRIAARLQQLEVSTTPNAEPVDVSLDSEDLTDLDLAENALAQGDRQRVERLLARVRANNPTQAEALAADYMLRRLDAARVRPDKIGLMLPLAGRYAAVGAQVRQAMQYGFRSAGGVGELVIVDSGTTEASAIAALEDLVLNKGVVAVAGPLLSDQADIVARTSEALRVPLIGLSQSLQPTDEQRWVFRATVSVDDQVAALLDYATQRGGMDSFGIFAPDNDYGRSAATSFERHAVAMGATVTVTEFYDPTSNDMTGAARSLARADYTARRAELARLRREASANGGDPGSVSLPPSIDFDGLFIPDNASRVPLACAALAYEEFPVGTFQPRPGSPSISLMGLNSWNNDDLLTQGGAYVRNSLFTELFIADDDASRSFESSFRSEFNRKPSPLEAVVYDVGRFTASVSKAGVSDRLSFRDTLLSTHTDSSVTGISSMSEDTRTAAHRVRILTITRDSIEVVE